MFISSHLGKQHVVQALNCLGELREAGIRSDMDYMDRKMKAQMKSADRLECANGRTVSVKMKWQKVLLILKNMADGAQEKVPCC